MSAPAPGYDGLLRELLLCLAGFSGDVFVEASVDAHAGFAAKQLVDHAALHLAADISWVDEPDRAILDELAQLGHYFRALHAFIEEEEAGVVAVPEDGRGAPGAGSMYCRALTEGLQELLEVYEAKLQEIQELVLSHQAPTLTRLQYLLADFMVLLPEAVKLVREVQLLRAKDFKGSELIAALHARARCGVPLVQSVMQRLLWHCNQVLIQQLTSWMVHGLLLDPFRESFIVAADPPLPSPSPPASSSSAAAAGVPSPEHDEWHGGCRVDVTRLPLYVSPEVASTILFVGTAVRVLKHPTGTFADQQLLSNSDTLEFVQALRELQLAHAFQRVAFEHTVEAIRSKVAAVLWQLVVVRADLMGHLSAIKDYFLLAKGDFYHTFLVEAAPLMGLPPRPAFADADVRVPFRHSGLKSTAQHDRCFHLFRIRWSAADPAKGGAGEAQRLDAWDSLYLEYQVEWPMGLLLTPPVMARYNVLFQFLMRLTRVQLRLEGAWQALHALYTHAAPMGADGGRGRTRDGRGERDGRLTQLYLLRHHMAHLVTNLQIYIQVDVIESSYAALEARIAGAHDFAEAERAHANYLHALVNQCFLNTVTISRAIGAVFKQACELCGMVDAYTRALAGGQPQAEALEACLAGLPSVHTSFHTSVNQLYTYLQSSRLQDANKAPHLRQLFLRLNFNDYVGGRVTQRVMALE
jgi:gamma-tubulin complex component 4